MNDHDAETVREIERLRMLAQWYRDWAALSGSSAVRENRSAGSVAGVAARVRATTRMSDRHDHLALSTKRLCRLRGLAAAGAEAQLKLFGEIMASLLVHDAIIGRGAGHGHPRAPV
jgi:hypothetical protein